MNDKTVLEGLLYIVGDDGLSLENARLVLEKSEEEIIKAIEEIKADYDSEDHGIELVNYGGVYKFVSKASINDFVTKLFSLNKTASLSPSALETLAIIAYKQPITRVEIEEIRGVNCEMMLRKLLSRNLIREAGRTEAPGRPYLYEVTQDFMDTFKLVSLNELPELPKYESGNEEGLFE